MNVMFVAYFIGIVLTFVLFTYGIVKSGDISEVAELGLGGCFILLILVALWPIALMLLFHVDEFSAWVDSLPDKSKKDQ